MIPWASHVICRHQTALFIIPPLLGIFPVTPPPVVPSETILRTVPVYLNRGYPHKNGAPQKNGAVTADGHSEILQYFMGFAVHSPQQHCERVRGAQTSYPWTEH